MDNQRERLQTIFRSRLNPPPKEAKKPHVLVRIINSPFTLWLLSALVLTVGGTFFTGYARCEADANRLITSYYKLQLELIRRLQYIQDGIARAKTAVDILHVLDMQPFVYDDFKSRTTLDLHYEMLRTERLIDFTKDKKVIAFTERIRGFHSQRGKPYDFVRFSGILVGEKPDELTDADVDIVKHLADGWLYNELTEIIAKNSTLLWPRCNFNNSVFGVPLRGPRKVIEADSVDTNGRSREK